MSNKDLFDVWTGMHPTLRGFTWRGQGVSSRQDRFYVSRSLSDLVHSCSVRVLRLSDHDGFEFILKCSIEKIPKIVYLQ